MLDGVSGTGRCSGGEYQPYHPVLDPPRAAARPQPDAAFTAPANYQAYIERTTEKAILKDKLTKAYMARALSIRPGEHRKRVLDLGSGLGTNTLVLSALFSDHDIHAIDVSGRFLGMAQENLGRHDVTKNTEFFHTAFEDFGRDGYDFILCSHVLQYINTDLEAFIRKIRESLTADGEAWIVLQEERGLNQIIQAARPYLDLGQAGSHFRDWFVHDRVRSVVSDLHGASTRYEHFESCFLAPSAHSPQKKDRDFLNFVLLDGFDPTNQDLSRAVESTIASMAPSRILPHDVGITRIRRGL